MPSSRGRPKVTNLLGASRSSSLWAENAYDAPMAAETMTIDFTRPDRIPMGLMNEIVWRSVRGADSAGPVIQLALATASDP